MKKVIVFVMVLVLLAYCSCQRCGGYDYPTDRRVSGCFFKVGSYFIYNDTADQIIDSQYVFMYSYLPNSVPQVYDGACFDYYSQYKMWETSYRNGLYYDSIYSYSPDAADLYYDYGNRTPFGALFNPSSSGPPCCSPLDTPFSNFSVGGKAYATVYEVPNCELFNDTVPTDLYFAQGYGVVKRVEHRPTGDVSWDLIRYHIVQ